MTNMIDCDAVFEVLTRAPFAGAGADQRLVEDHLRVCHDCRCLAEALRPAVGLFHETLAETDSLPRYSGSLPVASRERVVQPVSGLRGQALLAAGVAASLLAGIGFWTGTRDRIPAVLASPADARPDLAGRMTLLELHLPGGCGSSDSSRHDWRAIALPHVQPWAVGELPTGEAEFACCTRCHRSGGAGPATERAMRALDAACTACHRGSGSGPLAGDKLVETGRGLSKQKLQFPIGDRA